LFVTVSPGAPVHGKQNTIAWPDKEETSSCRKLHHLRNGYIPRQGCVCAGQRPQSWEFVVSVQLTSHGNEAVIDVPSVWFRCPFLTLLVLHGRASVGRCAKSRVRTYRRKTLAALETDWAFTWSILPFDYLPSPQQHSMCLGRSVIRIAKEAKSTTFHQCMYPMSYYFLVGS